MFDLRIENKYFRVPIKFDMRAIGSRKHNRGILV